MLLNVLGRAAWQVSAGVVVGSVLSVGAFVATRLGALTATPLLLASMAGIMVLVALPATFGPRESVRVQAVEASQAQVGGRFQPNGPGRERFLLFQSSAWLPNPFVPRTT